MGSAKAMRIRAISSREASAFIDRHHYSGKHKNNSQLHLGAFWSGRLEGVLQFGPSNDKRRMMNLVRHTTWNGFLELNRLAFTAALPRNSESRALAVCMRLLRRHRPEIRWVVSFADATMCGDGAIYRASGFVLTDIRVNAALAIDDEGQTHHVLKYQSNPVGTGYADLMKGGMSWQKFVKKKGWRILEGYQLRYVYFLDKTARADLTVPEIPFAEIAARGATMYRGQRP